MYKLGDKYLDYNYFYNNAREFTPAQIVEASKDALENWEWEADTRVENHALLRSFLEDWDEDFVITCFADDGIVRLDRAYKDIWEWLDEFAISGYNSYKWQ